MPTYGLDLFLPLDTGTLALFPHRPPVTQAAAPQCPGHVPWPLPSREAVFELAKTFLMREEGVPRHPYRPHDTTSGVSWGVGYDAGQQSAEAIRTTWKALPSSDLAKLEKCAHVRGTAADALLKDVKHIVISKSVAMDVFVRLLLPHYYTMAQHTFSGLLNMPAGTQVALTSLVYNRGGELYANKKHKDIFDRRWEMRRIADAVLALDLPEIERELRAMVRVWKGTKDEKGLKQRRNAEADLVATDIAMNQFLSHKPWRTLGHP